MYVSPRSRAFFTGQFSRDKFLFTTDLPAKLRTSEGGCCQVVYIIYRAVWAVYWAAFFVYDVVDESARHTFPTRLTTWAYIALGASAWLQLACSVYSRVLYKTGAREGKESQGTPVLYSVSWAAYSLSGAIAITVSLLYWALIYEGQELSFTSLSTHGVTSAYVLTDALITGVPTRLLHAWLPLAFGLLYFIFSLVYWLASGTIVYKTLDYEQSVGVAIAYFVGAMLATLIMHILLFLLYWLRVLIYDNCICSASNTGVRYDLEVVTRSPSGHLQGNTA